MVRRWEEEGSTLVDETGIYRHPGIIAEVLVCDELRNYGCQAERNSSYNQGYTEKKHDILVNNKTRVEVKSCNGVANNVYHFSWGSKRKFRTAIKYFDILALVFFQGNPQTKTEIIRYFTKDQVLELFNNSHTFSVKFGGVKFNLGHTAKVISNVL